MKVGIHDHEKNGYPNLALMKISAWHKSVGDTVSWFDPLFSYDKVYSAKVFSWTPKDRYLPADAVIGGTGFSLTDKLPEEIDAMCPDYELYGCNKSYGFFTRGCPRKCSGCVVPEKEGKIRAYQDVDDFVRHKDVVLMDNNVLASN